MPDVVTIAGSPSVPSRSSAVLDYARGVLKSNGLDSAALVVRNLPPEDLIYGRHDSPAIQEALGVVRAARGVIIATPMYKAAYAGVLKTFLDLLPPNGLAGKTILPIATGGSPVHFLAIDYALRPVLVALGAHTILNGVYIVDSQIQYADGDIRFDDTISERLHSSLQLLTDRLGLPC